MILLGVFLQLVQVRAAEVELDHRLAHARRRKQRHVLHGHAEVGIVLHDLPGVALDVELA